MIHVSHYKHVSFVNEAHQFIAAVLPEAGVAIDATVGNGLDTLFLAKRVGNLGTVYGFDIQLDALTIARERLDQAGTINRVTLLHQSHAFMQDYIPCQYQKKVHAVMFNLGFLPGGNKAIITRANTTISALNNAIQLLSPNGGISIVAYPGHEGGNIETQLIENWCKNIDASIFAIKIIVHQKNKFSAPRLIQIRRTTDYV